MADWANNGNFVSTPPSAYIDQGFDPQTPLAFKYLNWILNKFDGLYNTLFPTEHDATTGEHTDINAASSATRPVGGFLYNHTTTPADASLEIWKVVDPSLAPVSSQYGGAQELSWLLDDSGGPYGADGGAYVMANIAGAVLTDGTARYPIHDQCNVDITFSAGSHIFSLQEVSLIEFTRANNQEVVFTVYTIDYLGVRDDKWTRTYNNANPTGTGDPLTGFSYSIPADEAIFFEIVCNNAVTNLVAVPQRVLLKLIKRAVE